MTLPARQAFVAYRLRGLGYPLVVAMRVALTPPLTVARPSDDDPRPGRELREHVDLRFGQVVSMVAARVTPARRHP